MRRIYDILFNWHAIRVHVTHTHTWQVTRVVAEGLYNPQTMHGDIVVDGVLASVYTAAVAPALVRLHMISSPARVITQRRHMLSCGPSACCMRSATT